MSSITYSVLAYNPSSWGHKLWAAELNLKNVQRILQLEIQIIYKDEGYTIQLLVEIYQYLSVNRT